MIRVIMMATLACLGWGSCYRTMRAGSRSGRMVMVPATPEDAVSQHLQNEDGVDDLGEHDN